MHTFWSVQTAPIPPERVGKLVEWLATSEAQLFQRILIGRANLAIHEALEKGRSKEDLERIVEKYEFVLDFIGALQSGMEGDEPTDYSETKLIPQEP